MVIQDLKLLVIGIGSIGKRHSDVLYSDLGCKNILLWDPKEERAQEYAASYPGMRTVKTLEEGLAQNPDAVFICSPTALHMKQTELALHAGCHVMVEKPLALDMESLGSVMELAKEKKRIVSVALCHRHHKGIQRVKQITDSGQLGKIINIRATMSTYFPDDRPDYRQTYYVDYSGCFELIHALDYAIWMSNGNPQQIYGIHGSDADLGFRSPDNAEILFRTDNSVTCSVHLDFYRTPKQVELFVYGTEGTCELRYTHTSYSLRMYTRQTNCWQEENVDNLTRNMMFASEDQEFLQSIVTGHYHGCNMKDASRAVKVYCKVYGDQNPPPESWL